MMVQAQVFFAGGGGGPGVQSESLLPVTSLSAVLAATVLLVGNGKNGFDSFRVF